MKKMLLLLFAVMLLAGCGSKDEQPTETEQNTDDAPSTDVEGAAVQFNNIDITTPNGKIVVKAEAKAVNDEFFYVLKYGDQVVVDETKVQLDPDKNGWGNFNLEVDQPTDKQTKEQIPVFTFYVKNKAGEMVSPNYVPVDVAQE
jgi:hypothetical protein